jgi:amino acid transporter
MKLYIFIVVCVLIFLTGLFIYLFTMTTGEGRPVLAFGWYALILVLLNGAVGGYIMISRNKDKNDNE